MVDLEEQKRGSYGSVIWKWKWRDRPLIYRSGRGLGMHLAMPNV